ncbi:conserved hypothetical protein [Xenorhabdus nematophila str. Anatoliense]|nr:conserved hypothetical protein [Xenorhabdus nematophila str. Anatoliense]
MKEIRYSVKTQEQQTLTDSKGIGPETDKLKDKLKDGSIPLQTDFNQLIDIADIGRRATGQAPQQNGPGVGLKLDDNDTLNLKMGTLASQDFSPLILEKDILSVELGSGLINKDNGICVGQGNGITVSGNGVEVKAGNGITVNSSGVNIDPNKVLPRGMIVMFSGSSAPNGWAFCDGNYETPDLRSRFVMCGETISEIGKSSSKATGSGNGKKFSRNTTSTQVSVTVNVQDSTLTESQIPSHRHIGGMAYSHGFGMKYRYITGEYDKLQINNHLNSPIWMKPQSQLNCYAYTSSTGGKQGHNHQATASSLSHNHSIDVVPPY